MFIDKLDKHLYFDLQSTIKICSTWKMYDFTQNFPEYIETNAWKYFPSHEGRELLSLD